ncbi:MAG: magnesium transporter [Candidatus Aenigmatarchaeota archaeon]|nr:MAG: magnesium transporter [Candidatus Aenigmarchaeota archaeon]
MSLRDYEKIEQKITKEELRELHKIWGLTHKDFTEIFAAETLALTGSVLTGVVLAIFLNRLELVPAFFIALPGFLEMRGAVGGSLSARLSSAMFVGHLKPTIRNNHILRGNVFATFVLTIVGALFLGLVAYFIELALFGIAFPQIITILLLASVISNLIEIPLTVATTFALFKRDVDPNNVMGPYVTTQADVVSVASVLIAIVLIL